MTALAFLSAFPPLLLEWYDHHARILPWRENPFPYFVWVSEIMLQQTRVEAVKPYFERFITALPTVRALAQVDPDRLLKLWEGLGYYNRVRNLQKAAQLIMVAHKGELPADYPTLLTLPGIGAYTAGAIASIAYGIAVPAVDGNVLRVLMRWTACRDDITKPAVKQWATAQIQAILPKRVGDFNQSLMELGATVCTPNGVPKCLECPVREHCLGFSQGIAQELPYKTPKKPRTIEDWTVLLLEWEGRYAIRRREPKGLLAGMWEFISLEGSLTAEQVKDSLRGMAVESVESLPSARHIFTHKEWKMCGYRVKLSSNPQNGWSFVEPEQLRLQYAVPSAYQVYSAIAQEDDFE